MSRPISLTVVVPVLNEQKIMSEVIAETIDTLQEMVPDWEIILVNDGSSDRTGEIALALAREHPRIVKVLHHKKPMGIGRCFTEGIQISTKDAITWFPVNGANNAREILKYLPLLEHVHMAVPFVINKEVTVFWRRVLSRLYVSVINFSFGTTFHYTNGAVIYRRQVFEKVGIKSSSAFFLAESLIRATRAGFSFVEIPVLLNRRRSGRSKIVSFKSMSAVFREFLRLFLEIRFKKQS